MKIHENRFNIYLLLALMLGLVAGCQSPEKKRTKAVSTLRLYQEVKGDTSAHSQVVPVYRESPVKMTVADTPFVTEAFIKHAKVIDTMGGFAIVLDFDIDGRLLLEQYTSAARSRHIAVFSQWAVPPDWKLNKGRWLAAPKIAVHIADGTFSFTPDTTRQEAEQIVLGLNNVAKKVQDKEMK